MQRQMKNLAIVLLSIAATAAYRDGRTASSIRPFDEFPPYQRTQEHPPFENRYQSFREQPFKSQYYHFYRSRPFREEPSYRDRGLYKDQSLVPEYSSYKDQPYYSQPPFKPHRTEGTFDKPSTFYGNPSSLKDNFGYKSHSFADATSLRNHYRDQMAGRYEDSFPQLSHKDQVQYEQQREEFQANQSESYKPQAYAKPPMSEKEQLDEQASNYYRLSDYLKYGNHGLGFASVPGISSYENPLPLNEETSAATEPSTPPTATHRPLLQSTVSVSSTPSAITEIHTSAASQSKMPSVQSSTPATTQSVKSDTLAEMLPTVTSQTSSANPAMSTAAATKESPNLGHSSAPLAKNMVTVTPTAPFEGHTLPTIQFHLANITAPTPPAFYLSDEAKNAFKASIQAQMLKYVLPELSSNNVDTLIQKPAINYVLPTEAKDSIKDSLRDSLLNFFLQQRSKDRLSYPQSSISETVNYVPLSTVNENPMSSLPSLPLAALSAISRPVQTVNYLSSNTQKLPFLPAASVASNNFHFDRSLPSALTPTLQNAFLTRISGGLPVGLTGGTSTEVPSSVPASISSGMRAFNLGQTFTQLGQLRPFEPVRNQPYAQGLPLQLGGFGGIDYSALRPSNPASQPMELGIAKVGLSLPELPRPHVPTFTKVGFGQQIW